MRLWRRLNQEVNSEKKEILVVDDELLIRDLLYDFLTSHGYIVRLAENGQKALEVIDKHNIQTALVDLKMPKMDGLQFTSILYEEKPHIPVIIMTAYPSMDSAIESIRNGVFDYIVKPFKMNNILDILIKAVKEFKFRMKVGNSRNKNSANKAVK